MELHGRVLENCRRQQYRRDGMPGAYLQTWSYHMTHVIYYNGE
jgi:hypothetical protein